MKVDKKYVDDVCQYAGDQVDLEVIHALYGSLASVLGNQDSANVAFSDESELQTVKQNFLKDKLGVEGDEADAALEKVGEMMSGDNSKNRLTVYYLLVDELGARDKVC